MFSDFRARLASQQVLELNIQLLLLLNDHVFLNDLLSLLNQTLLECLDLLEHLPGVRVSAFKLPPSMVVEWVFELFGEGLHGETLVEELLVEVDNLVLEVRDLISLRLNNSEFALEISDGVVEDLDVQETLLVLVLTLRQGCLQNLDLLIQQSQFVVSSNELSTEHVSLVNHFSDFLLLDLMFVVGLFDNEGELKLLHLEFVDDAAQLLVLLLLHVHFVLVFV